MEITKKSGSGAGREDISIIWKKHSIGLVSYQDLLVVN